LKLKALVIIPPARLAFRFSIRLWRHSIFLLKLTETLRTLNETWSVASGTSLVVVRNLGGTKWQNGGSQTADQRH
jgi:hypothetical protein